MRLRIASVIAAFALLGSISPALACAERSERIQAASRRMCARATWHRLLASACSRNYARQRTIVAPDAPPKGTRSCGESSRRMAIA
jgi:hypothetical protein